MSGDLYWYKPPQPSGETLVEMLERLKPLGIRWKDWNAPHATYTVTDGQLVKKIGQLFVGSKTGLINIWPYEGISYREMVILAGCAQEAFEHKPSVATMWARKRRKNADGWRTDICVRAGKGTDFMAQRIAQDLERSYTEAVLHAQAMEVAI